MLIPPWLSLGEDWRVTFPPSIGQLNFDHYFGFGFDSLACKGGYYLAWVWNTLSNYGPVPPHPSTSYLFLSVFDLWNLVDEDANVLYVPMFHTLMDL